jgi:hypothetical protein
MQSAPPTLCKAKHSINFNMLRNPFIPIYTKLYQLVNERFLNIQHDGNNS